MAWIKLGQALSLSMLLGVLSACATSAGGEGESEVLMPDPSTDAEGAANKLLGSVLTFNTLVSTEVLRLREQLPDDRLALTEALNETLLMPTDGEPLIQLAKEELLSQSRSTDEDELAGNVQGVASNFDEISSNPRSKFADERFALLTDEAAVLSGRLQERFRSANADSAKTAYYFAAAFNFVTNVRIVAWTTLDRAAPIESLYRKAYDVNARLVAADEIRSDGLVNTYVVEHDPRKVSDQTKLDADPIVYFVRRTLAEQQRVFQ